MKGRLVYQTSMHPIYFWPRGTSGQIRGAVCPHPCPPAGAGSAVLSTNGGAEGRSWALVPVPVNAFAQLYRPSVSRSGSGIAVGGTHAHMGWPSSCLGRSQRGAGLASRAACAYYCARCTASASLAPWFIVRTEVMCRFPLADAYPSETSQEGMYFK